MTLLPFFNFSLLSCCSFCYFLLLFSLSLSLSLSFWLSLSLSPSLSLSLSLSPLSPSLSFSLFFLSLYLSSLIFPLSLFLSFFLSLSLSILSLSLSLSLSLFLSLSPLSLSLFGSFSFSLSLSLSLSFSLSLSRSFSLFLSLPLGELAPFVSLVSFCLSRYAFRAIFSLFFCFFSVFFVFARVLCPRRSCSLVLSVVCARSFSLLRLLRLPRALARSWSCARLFFLFVSFSPLLFFFPSPFAYGDLLFFVLLCSARFNPTLLSRSFSFALQPHPFSVPPLMCLCFADVLIYICLLSFAAHKPPALSVTPAAAQKTPCPFCDPFCAFR